MGQSDIIIFLKNNTERWFSAREISKALGIHIGPITTGLSKLRKFNMIEWRQREDPKIKTGPFPLEYKLKEKKNLGVV